MRSRSDTMIPTPDAAHQALDTPPPRRVGQEEPLRTRDFMSVAPVTTSPDTSIEAAHTLMQQRCIRHLPVLEHGCLVGMVSDRDLRLVLPSPTTNLSGWELRHRRAKLTVGKIMTRLVVAVTPDCPVAEAVGYLLRHKTGALPVVEAHQIVGLLTRTDILRALLRLQAGWPGLPWVTHENLPRMRQGEATMSSHEVYIQETQTLAGEEYTV
jgi:acetoin utilization protein AcuB